MEDKESGSLSQHAVLDLIVELYQGTVTGSLKLERAPLQKAVYFRDGQILFAASNDPKDQLASILVEEGKLGPDQMQVAQARVSPGNPLAKVLTELGYISQRELADAARVKVEKILTDLYTWNEGTYQFATKSLPKGAIDLDLSTPELIYASIRRIQDRDWVLRVLGSLDAVLGPTSNLDNFIGETKADAQAAEVLRLVDSVKNVTQIGAQSSLGEFEVCKVLAAGVVVGALTKVGAAAPVAAADDAFSVPSEPPAFDPGPAAQADVPLVGADTVGLDTSAAPPLPESAESAGTFQPPDATVFEEPPAPKPLPPAGEALDKTIFEAPPSALPTQPIPAEPSAPPRTDFAPNATASELLIDEPEPEIEEESLGARTPPRPRGGRRGGGSSGSLVGILKIAGVIILAAAAAFAVYTFVWPMIGGGTDAPPTTAGGTTPTPTTVVPDEGSTDPDAVPSTGPGTETNPPSTDPRAGGPQPAPPPATTSAAPAGQPSTTTTRPGPTPPPTSTRPSSGGSGHQLLAGGDIPGAASAFLRELRSSGRDKFTVAVGLYCNEENVGRVVQSARGAGELYVLPTTIEGRRCFRVVWGTYDTRRAAEQGMGSLPSGLRAGDAAAVPVASVLR